MTYEIQPLAFDPTSLNGLSAKLIGSHHLNNYGGAVRRLNAIRSELTGLDWSSTPGYRINGIKREELIAANSAFLHELYFQTLGAGDSLRPGGNRSGSASSRRCRESSPTASRCHSSVGAARHGCARAGSDRRAAPAAAR